MDNTFFITGTDTDCGKTYYTVKLLQQLNKQDQTTIGIKPVASGCQMTPEGLRNDDALKLINASSIKLPYDYINPFRFYEPVAPHIPAAVDNRLTIDNLIDALEPALSFKSDCKLIEGAGGVMVPLNQDELMIDLIKVLDIPIIFVAGLKLGCINHTLLSLSMIKRYQITVAEIYLNRIDPLMHRVDENIHFLTEWITNHFPTTPIRTCLTQPSIFSTIDI